MAGGVWWLEEWEDWIDNPELGPIAFQFGTRPLLTKESPIGDAWKQRLLTLQEGDVFLNHFSPTGFYSSAVNNGFIRELRERNERQVAFTTEVVGEHVAEYGVGPRKRIVYLTRGRPRAGARLGSAGLHRGAAHAGFDIDLRHAREGAADHSPTRSPAWAASASAASPTGASTRPATAAASGRTRAASASRRRCRSIAHESDEPDAVERNLMFSGHNAYRFASDPFYSNGFIPTVKQLVERILTGR